MAKMRSPNYPAIGLPDALAEAQKIWDKEKKTPVGIEVLGHAMGYKSLSGPVRTKVAALRKYGLLDQNGGVYSLSDLARTALLGQPEEQAQARAIAAKKPELFKELIETHPDASDAALKSELMLRRSFGESGAKQFIKAFRETLSIADPTKSGYSGPEDGGVPEALTTSIAQEQTKTSSQIHASRAVTTKTFTWPLSRGVTAEVRFSGGEVQAAHLDTLAKYLELAKTAIDTEDEPSDN